MQTLVICMTHSSTRMCLFNREAFKVAIKSVSNVGKLLKSDTNRLYKVSYINNMSPCPVTQIRRKNLSMHHKFSVNQKMSTQTLVLQVWQITQLLLLLLIEHLYSALSFKKISNVLHALCQSVHGKQKTLKRTLTRVQGKHFVFQIRRKTVPCRRTSTGECPPASSRQSRKRNCWDWKPDCLMTQYSRRRWTSEHTDDDAE